MKILMKWVQFINNYQNSTLGGPITKHFVFNLLVLPDVCNCSLKKKSAPLFPEGTVKYTSGSIANSLRMLTKIKKWCYSQNKDLRGKSYCQTLKT